MFSLHSLSSVGNDAEIQDLLSQGYHVDHPNEVDSTPLFYAANGGHLSTVKLLVEAGADVNKRNHHGQTPLMWAVLSKNEELVEYLIDKGADVDVKGDGGLSAFGLSLVASNPLISTLIKSNSDDESLSTKSNSPLFARGSIEEELNREGAMRINEARRSLSNPDLQGKKIITNSNSPSRSFDGQRPPALDPDPPTIRYTQTFTDLPDTILLDSQSVSSLDISLIPLTSQVKECKATYSTLLRRKIMGEFLIKRGGVRTNWKCRYFLLTGDHLHYFEPQISPRSGDALQEPSPNAVPLGSISLHSIVGNVHKSDLGIVFCFQIPTAGGRTYHIKAPSARSVEKWTNVLNSNAKRIQSSSSRFTDMVFRISTVWKAGLERSTLRTGREFHTMDAMIEDCFNHLSNPPLFPTYLLEEQATGSSEMLALLADYIKSLLSTGDHQLTEVGSKFVTDQGAEYFTIESRQKFAGMENGAFDIRLNNEITCLALSPVSTEKSRIHQFLVVCDHDQAAGTSNLHMYEYDGCPQLADSQHKWEQCIGQVLAINFGVDNSYFTVTSFVETRKVNGADPKGRNFVGNLETFVFDTQMLEELACLKGGEFTFEKYPAHAARDHVDTIVTKRKGVLTHFVAKVSTTKTVQLWNVLGKSHYKTLSVDLKGTDKVNAIKFNRAEPSMLAIASDQGIQLWDFTKNDVLVSLKHPCTTISFSPDGKKIAGLGFYKSKVKCWETRTGKRIKKLAAGFSTMKDDHSLQFHPVVSFHPKNQQLLVISSFGDLISWNYELESGEETVTVMNSEHMAGNESERDQAHPMKKDSSWEADMLLKKAKALEPAIFAECKGCVNVFAVKTKFARYFMGGLVVAVLSQASKEISLYLSRNGDLICSFPLDNPISDIDSVIVEVSHDGKHITYADGPKICTRAIPLDRNGDIMEVAKETDPAEEEEEKFVSIGWTPRHIENDPMIPYQEHQLIMAVAEGNPDKVKKLITSNNLNVNFFSVMNGWTPLTLAAKLGQSKIVRTLLKSGADVSMPRRADNMRPLHAAVSSGDSKTVLTLIENGANPNATWDPVYPENTVDWRVKKEQVTLVAPLHLAAVNGFAEIIEILLSCGADIECKESNDRTPIIYAARKKENFAAVQILVKKGADCTARGRTGTSAMHEAAKADSQKMVSLLLKEGAEAENERNSRGETAVDLNPQLFVQKKYERYLRSDTKTYLKYQMKMKSK